MTSPRESRAALQRLTTGAVDASLTMFSRFSGSAEVQRVGLLETIPDLIDYWSDGSSALALDFYEDQRELAGVTSRFVPQIVDEDRTVKTRRALAWAAEPLFADLADTETVSLRLAEIVQLEVARPYRTTILANSNADPAAIGWKRITNQCCPFCRMLADRGAVYRESTARFAAHRNCDCSAAPVFRGGEAGPEASALQYRASRKNRTPAQRAQLNAYLAENY